MIAISRFSIATLSISTFGKSFFCGALAAFCMLIFVGFASGSQDVTVSQKNRQFNPDTISVARDQAVTIVNDDGDLLHHVYVESDIFSFDSGDQQPGGSARITFSVTGEFKVLCGIHPKMKLAVQVRD